MRWQARIARRLAKGEALLCEDLAALGLDSLFGDHDPDRCDPEAPYCECISKANGWDYTPDGDLPSRLYDQGCDRQSTAEGPGLRLRFCCECSDQCDREGLSRADLLAEVRGLLIFEGLLKPQAEAA